MQIAQTHTHTGEQHACIAHRHTRIEARHACITHRHTHRSTARVHCAHACPPVHASAACEALPLPAGAAARAPPAAPPAQPLAAAARASAAVRCAVGPPAACRVKLQAHERHAHMHRCADAAAIV